jgi:hypothetical protein
MKNDLEFIKPFYKTKIFVAMSIDTIIEDFEFFTPSIFLQRQVPF